jgi:hypothetical protein
MHAGGTAFRALTRFAGKEIQGTTESTEERIKDRSAPLIRSV